MGGAVGCGLWVVGFMTGVAVPLLDVELQLEEVLIELQEPAEQQEAALELLLQLEAEEDRELELEEAGLSKLRSLIFGLATPSLP